MGELNRVSHATARLALVVAVAGLALVACVSSPARADYYFNPCTVFDNRADAQLYEKTATRFTTMHCSTLGGMEIRVRPRTTGSASNGEVARWFWNLPKEVSIGAADFSADIVDYQGWVSRVHLQSSKYPDLTQTLPAYTDQRQWPSTKGIFDDYSFSPSSFLSTGDTLYDRVILQTYCGGNTCPWSDTAYVKARDIRIEMRDETAPTITLSKFQEIQEGQGARVEVSVADDGGGVFSWEMRNKKSKGLVDFGSSDCDSFSSDSDSFMGITASDIRWTGSLSPCPSRVGPISVPIPWYQLDVGMNEFEVCASDVGARPVGRMTNSETSNSSCRTSKIWVKRKKVDRPELPRPDPPKPVKVPKFKYSVFVISSEDTGKPKGFWALIVRASRPSEADGLKVMISCEDARCRKTMDGRRVVGTRTMDRRGRIYIKTAVDQFSGDARYISGKFRITVYDKRRKKIGRFKYLSFSTARTEAGKLPKSSRFWCLDPGKVRTAGRFSCHR